MDGGACPTDTVVGSLPDYSMDLDYMDELFLEGCWLETTDGSDFLNYNPLTSSPPFDPSIWDNLEANNSEANGGLLQTDSPEERQISSLPVNLAISQSQAQLPAKTESLGQNMIYGSGNLNLSKNSLAEDSELITTWWIEPKANNHISESSVMERLIQAVGYIKNSTRDKNVLIQIWVPVNRNGKRVLTTSDQPFSLDNNCPGLASYRDISVKYQFPAEDDSKEIVGLPGRVFRGKVPEWTPDVQFFRREEYPRVGYAQQYDVRGTLAVPVFEQGSRNCLGVIEVIMTTQKINYHPELESVCRALEAVDLRSSEVSGMQNVKASDGSYQAALPEILQVLRSACGAHRLPLAQTWVSCVQQGKGGCRHSDENLVHCVSTLDSACYVADPLILGFHEACSEHHLLKGQGVAGKAFVTNQPRFSPDVTCFSKTEYPLSHHARMFGLSAAVAIRLRSIYTANADFVLEFFLPKDCKDPEEQKILLTSLSSILQKVCCSLRVITDAELQQEETVLLVGEAMIPSDGTLRGADVPEPEEPEGSHSVISLGEVPFWPSSHLKAQRCNSNIVPSKKPKPREALGQDALEFRQDHHDTNPRETVAFSGDHSTSSHGISLDISKTAERRRTKIEKAITLQMLRQYFSGSLKDAAKSIGVCPTTLKRICRQHGIKRWPSRTLKKVDHSLRKIQLVIDSVQGASNAFQINSFYSTFPELATPNSSRNDRTFLTSKTSGDSEPLYRQNMAEDGKFSPQSQPAASKSPSSSCNQSSSSSQCCSSGTHPLPYSSNDDPIISSVKEDSSSSVMKRARSDTDLHLYILSDDEPKLISGSQRHRTLVEHPKCDLLSPLPKETQTQGNFQERDTPRVKVKYGQDKIQFRMQNSWGYQELLQQIAQRFAINDFSGFQLKYLDDDSEWVLLTCDADFEECVDVSQSSQGNTIKLCITGDPQKLSRNSSGSKGLS